MQRILRRRAGFWALAGAALAVLLLAALPGRALMAGEDRGQLVVTGRAELSVEPDMAVVQIGAETRAETVEEARKANAEIMQRVQSRLLSLGLDAKDLKSRGFYVYPEWQYDREEGTQTLLGYRVTHTLQVTVNDLDLVGPVLDAAMQEGANQISGPTFGLKDTAALEAEALQEAVRRARAKAEAIAEASGVFLKGITEIRESVAVPYAPAARSAYVAVDALEVATQISPGEVSVTATVTISYEI